MDIDNPHVQASRHPSNAYLASEAELSADFTSSIAFMALEMAVYTALDFGLSTANKIACAMFSLLQASRYFGTHQVLQSPESWLAGSQVQYLHCLLQSGAE